MLGDSMSKSVVTATTAARAKSLTRAKAHKGEQQNHKTEEAVVPQHANDDVQALAVHDVKGDNSLAGDFSFSGVMADAASSASMTEATAGAFGGGMSSFAQDSGGEGGGLFGGDSTPLIIGGVVLVGAGIAIAASGGDDNKTPTPTPTPNVAPVATASTAAGNEDSKITGKITATDANTTDTLTWAVKGTAPAGFTIGTDGSYTLDASNAAYQSLAAGAKSTVVANVTVSDGKGGTADSTVTFTVTGVNDAPTLDATTTKAFSVVSGAASKFTISATDVDAGDKLTATLSTGPSNGTIDLATNTYTAKAGFTGTDTFTVKVTDTAGASVSQVVTVTITAPPSQNATISAAGTTDATTGNNTYTVVQGNYNHTITGFAAGDKIVGPGNYGTLENASFTDGKAVIQFATGGQITQIELTGLTNAQDAQLFGTSDLNTVFGAGTFA
jgi:VCBS repeat-containing protein